MMRFASAVAVRTFFSVLYICGLEAAVQISYADGFHLVAGARDEVRLHAPLRADEQELRIRRGHGYAPGNGKGGVYVSGGTAAGEEEFHTLPPIMYIFTAAPGCPAKR